MPRVPSGEKARRWVVEKWDVLLWAWVLGALLVAAHGAKHTRGHAALGGGVLREAENVAIGETDMRWHWRRGRNDLDDVFHGLWWMAGLELASWLRVYVTWNLGGLRGVGWRADVYRSPDKPVMLGTDEWVEARRVRSHLIFGRGRLLVTVWWRRDNTIPLDWGCVHDRAKVLHNIQTTWGVQI